MAIYNNCIVLTPRHVELKGWTINEVKEWGEKGHVKTSYKRWVLMID
jgi:hypothetical protein